MASAARAAEHLRKHGPAPLSICASTAAPEEEEIVSATSAQARLRRVRSAYLLVADFCNWGTEGHIMANLDKLRSLVVEAVKHLATAFFIFGDVQIQLRASGLTLEQARDRVRSWAGADKGRLGISLSDAYLRAAHDAAVLFHDEGGLASPDGKHRVTRAEFLTLPLSKGKGERIIALLKLSEALPKGLKRLRVMDIKEVVDAKDKVKAMSKLMATVDEVEQAIQLASFGSPVDMARHKWVQAQEKTRRAYEGLLKAREAEAEAEAEYVALRDLRASAAEATATVAPEAEQPISSASVVPPQRSAGRTASRAQGATA